MTRLVTGAALVGLLQGAVLVLLLRPLGLGSVTEGWFGYSPFTASPYFGSAIPGSPSTRLLAVPLLLAVLAAAAAALAQQRGWLGTRSPAGGATAGRVGVAALLVAAVSVVLTPRFTRPPRRYADYLPADHSPPWAVLLGVVLAGAVLVVLAGLRERRRWGRSAFAGVVIVAALGAVAQRALLEPPGIVVLACQVLAVVLGIATLVIDRRQYSPGS